MYTADEQKAEESWDSLDKQGRNSSEAVSARNMLRSVSELSFSLIILGRSFT